MKSINIYKYILAIYLFVIFFFQFNQAHKSERDVDEFHSIYVANGFHGDNSKILNQIFHQNDFFKNNNFKSVLDLTIKLESGNSILYNTALHYWIMMTSNSIPTTRILSILFYLGAIVMVFFLSNFLFKKEKLSLVSAMLFSINPLIMNFGINSRCYMAAAFFTLLSTFLFLKWKFFLTELFDRKKTIKYGIFYGLSIGASLLVHYYCFYILIIHCLFIVLPLLKLPLKTSMLSLIPSGIIVLIFGTWLLIGGVEGYGYMKAGNEFQKKYASDKNKAVNFSEPFSIKNTAQYGFDTYNAWSYNFHYWRYFDFGLKMRYISILLCIPLIFLFGVFIELKKHISSRSNLYLLIALCVMPPILFVYLAFKEGYTIYYSARYGVMALPYFTILLTVGFFSLLSSAKKRHYKIVLILCGAIFLINAFVLGFGLKENANDPNVMGLSTQMHKEIEPILTKIKTPENTTIEFGTAHMACVFNFSAPTGYNLFPQKINPSLKPNEVYISMGKERKSLYVFPEKYTGMEIKFYK